MTEQEYLAFLRDSIRKSYLNTQEGRPDDKHKYRTEGLIHAARLMVMLSATEITDMIEKEHQDVFGESVAARKARLASFEKLKEESIDDYFEVPAIQRKR